MSILINIMYKTTYNHIETTQNHIHAQEKMKGNNHSAEGINNWTFGIVTGGKRRDWIEKQIQSIVAQEIPNFEIKFCGDYQEREEKFIKYINLHEESPRITTKKNAICKVAKYENIAMFHDRVFLNKDWFKGMKKCGNYWDVIGCRFLLKGKRGV